MQFLIYTYNNTTPTPQWRKKKLFPEIKDFKGSKHSWLIVALGDGEEFNDQILW